jgi:hypothetical protein
MLQTSHPIHQWCAKIKLTFSFHFLANMNLAKTGLLMPHSLVWFQNLPHRKDFQDL